jgi:dynein heavy chain
VRTGAQVRTECDKVLKMSLFNPLSAKSVRLEDFEQLQRQASDITSGYLKETWVVTLKNGITNTFKDSGKGWFNGRNTLRAKVAARVHSPAHNPRRRWAP